MRRSRTVRVPAGITCNMVSKVICVWLFVCVVAISTEDEPKRDKRTVDILLRGAADLFGYDVVRRISSPTFRQSGATPRPTFFPPPVAPQLPSGSYSRVILALGQQQQQQQQELQRRIEQSIQSAPQASPQLIAQPQQQQQQQQQQSPVLNIPQNGALTASAESVHFPGGGLLPLFQVPSSGAQVSLLSALQAAPQALAPIPPVSIQRASLTTIPLASPIQQPAQQQGAQQQQQAAPQQTTVAPSPQSAQNQAVDGNNPPFGIPLRLVAIAPEQGFGPNGQLQNAAQGQTAVPQQSPAGTSAPPSAAPPADTAGSQPQTNGVSIVLDQGPTRWNLFSLPRQEASVRRSLNLNLNWNRNVEPATAGQFQLVPVPLQTTPTPPLQLQQVQPTQAPQQTAQQQQLPAPAPTIENFEITVQPENSFNRYYNIPDNFQAKTAAQRQNDANVRFRDSVRSFWESAPSTGENGNSERSSLREPLRPRFEEYNSENNAEELNAPESEQLVEDNNEVIAPSDNSNRREDYNEANDENKPRSRRFRQNSDRFDEESSDTPKYNRRRNKIRRIRKVKKSVDNDGGNKSDAHSVFKREEQSFEENARHNEVNDSHKNFFAITSGEKN